MFLSGCAYDSYYDRYAYNYDYDYDDGYRPVHHFYFQNGVRYDRRFSYNVAFCG
jgi:hypothetical protein